jgi:CheY-like chemotaxis protein
VSNAVRVLVVEDEALICSFIEDALSDGGFEACSVYSGEAALSTFREGREGCRALLTDVIPNSLATVKRCAGETRRLTPINGRTTVLWSVYGRDLRRCVCVQWQGEVKRGPMGYVCRGP